MQPSTQRLARPASVVGALAILTSGLLFVGRSADPARADPSVDAVRSGTVRDAGLAATIALDRLHTALEASLSAGRQGTAATVDGESDPAPALGSAADLLDAAGGSADAAMLAVDRVSGVANGEGLAMTRLHLNPGLPAIAAQLRGAVEPASTFASMRRRTERVVTQLGAALTALDRGDLAAAVEAVGGADADLAAIRAWQPGLVTLPLWIKTAGRLLDALRSGSDALTSGDTDALARARRDFAAAAPEAHRADLALGIAMAEGGSAIADPALRGLARAIDDVEGSARGVASVLRALNSP
ncbi:MAG: hypothetical protein ABJB65_07260 [Chloroflexota bacterium]